MKLNKQIISYTIYTLFFLLGCSPSIPIIEPLPNPNKFIDWGMEKPTSRDMAKHIIDDKNYFEWW